MVSSSLFPSLIQESPSLTCHLIPISAAFRIAAEDSFPPEYSDLFLQTLQKEAVLSRNQSGGGTSLSLGSLRDTLSLVCGLPALQIDKIINLVSPPGAVGGVGGNAEVGRNRVNRLEFFVALALAAFAQLGKGECDDYPLSACAWIAA